jgi:dTDP-glucose pyrophosphorylase
MIHQDTWLETILPLKSTIADAVQILNRVALKIVLITDESGVLLGTISDGDIRRGLLNGLTLDSPIDSVVHRDPIVVSPEIRSSTVSELMKINAIQQIPIVNQYQQAVGLHIWNELSQQVPRVNSVVIMAGGKGTRLLPQTEDCPKPMLLVAGKPILEHIIERAKAEGFSHFILAVYHLSNKIEEYFGDGESLGVRIDYLREKFPLGTAGALSLLNPVPNSPIIVTNGDLITEIHYSDLLEFHELHEASATMAVRTLEWQNPFGVVETDGINIKRYDEKPIFHNQINAGVYVLNPSALTLIPKSEAIDMPALFNILKEEDERLIAFPIHEQWLDIGQPKDLEYIRLRFESESKD